MNNSLNCPLCGAESSLTYRLGHTDIARCRSRDCGLMFTTTQPTESELQGIYNGLYYGEGDITTEAAEMPNSDDYKFRQHAAEIDHLCGLRNKRILDYGCGIGNFLHVAREMGAAEVCGVELNERARRVAHGRGFRVEPTINNFEDEYFDIIYMNDVIEHLRDPVGALKIAKGKLIKNGLLVVITMNVDGAKAKLLRSKWSLITDPTHFYFYNPASLARTLEDAGFEDIELAKWEVDFSHHGFIRKLLQRILVAAGQDTGLKMLAHRPLEEV